MANLSLEHKFTRDKKSDKMTYIVKSLHKITEQEAADAFNNFIACNVLASEDPRIVKICFEDWATKPMG